MCWRGSTEELLDPRRHRPTYLRPCSNVRWLTVAIATLCWLGTEATSTGHPSANTLKQDEWASARQAEAVRLAHRQSIGYRRGLKP